jgi:membrane fusion protein, macrolide-specific efflux system
VSQTRPRLPRRQIVTIALALSALGASAAAAFAVGSDSSTSQASTSRTVTVKRGVIQATVSGSGSLAAHRDQELAFSKAGTVKRVLVGAGDHVTKGQLLATLKTTNGYTSRLRAPFTGTIASASIDVGDTVGGASSGSSSGSASTASSTDTTTAFELVSRTSYDMTVSLSESDIGKVKKGQTATVTVSATGDELAAKVADVSLLPASSDASTGTASSSSSSAVSYSVTLRLTQTASDLKPGMSASADIVTSETTGLTVPSAAVRGNRVTVVRDGKNSTVQVQTGVVGDSTTQIVRGLSAGDQVLITSTSAAAGASASPSSSSGRTQGGGLGGGFNGGPPAGGPPAGGGFGG